MANKKVIKLNYPLDYIRKYVKQFVTKSKEVATTDAEKAMLDDIGTMVEVAASVMVQTKVN